MAKAKKLPESQQPWIEARRRYRLTHAQVQMARELGLNPKKFGGLANHRQEPWKMPLADYIEHLYQKRFGRRAPEQTRSLEENFAQQQRKKTGTQRTQESRRTQTSGCRRSGATNL